MVIATRQETEPKARTRRALIDCDFHNELDSIKDLYPYLSQRWRDHIDTYGTRGPGGAYYPRFMDHRADARMTAASCRSSSAVDPRSRWAGASTGPSTKRAPRRACT